MTFAMSTAYAATPITLLDQHIGHTNYIATGGSLRNQPNTANACSLNASSTAAISGIPATATIRAVYLYWVGSGTATDSSVTLNGATVAAQRTDTVVFPFNGTNYTFFSGFAEISGANIVNGNGNYTFSGLSVNSGNPYCSVQVVLSGWSMYVVYDDPAELLHAVNIFDGFQFFRGSAINLTASGFRIPPTLITGQFTFSHFEGDPQNSTASGGFSEALSINGNLVDDGLVPPASNPVTQPYDGTINSLGIQTSHGVDVDTYDATPFLSSGDTSATVTMSAGGDLVLSTGMIIAINTEPLVDLSVSATHVDTFVAGQNAELLIDVSNAGPEVESNDIAITDTLPAGLSFVSATGGSWSCAPNGQDVDCTYPGPLGTGASLPQLVITVAIDPSAIGDLDTIVTVSSASLDQNPANDQVTDTVTVVASDLSTSTKTVLDLNGGDANPGDTLRYTITLIESANVAASGVTVTDDIPQHISGYAIVSVPPGTTDNSTSVGGANGNGFIDLSTIDVAAGTSVAIVFDAVIAGTAVPGDVISNTAAITNPAGPGANPLAPNVIVSQSQVSASGTKTLYLYDTNSADPNGFNNGARPYLSRTPPVAPQTNVTVDKNQPPRIWRLTPALQSELRIASGTVPVTLHVSKGGGNGNSVQRILRIELRDSTGLIGAPVQLTFAAPPSGTPLALTFNVPLAADRTVGAGETVTLTATNLTGGGNSRRIRVFPISGGTFSRIDMTALTVINVDDIVVYDAPYPGGVAITDTAPGATISIRSTVSDPFGSFDIASVTLDLEDPTATPVLTGQAMTRVADSNAATATFEYLYFVPATNGNWTARVTANEGTEGLVSHTRNGLFSVTSLFPGLSIAKQVAPESDPVNGSANPFNIPGAIVLYTITVTNTGTGSPDASSLRITDVVPPATALVVDPVFGPPVTFVDGTVNSGLGPGTIAYSDQAGGGPPYDHIVTLGPDGTDPAITGIEVTPSGQMLPMSAGGTPSFSLEFRGRIHDPVP